MNLLLGKYEHTIDDKSRLTIPSKLRNKIGSELYISKGFDGCLEVRGPEEFEKWTNEVLNFKVTNDRARFFGREIFANSTDAEMDSAGRVKLPANLMELSGLSKDVYIIGAGNRLEIWDREKYDNYEEKNEDKFEEIANDLGSAL